MTNNQHTCLSCQQALSHEMLACPYCGFKIGSGEHAEAWLGETLDEKYHIEEILGVGGMGMVFKATRVFLGDPVALKILFPHLLHHALQRRLFEDEAIATAQLNHPNIVTIYDTDIDQNYNIAYMAMELLEGIPFKEIMREKAPMKAEDLYDPLIQICNGLYAAHELGLIHRDLKPDNIFVSPEKDGHSTYKILDFGIATLAGEINEDEENKLLGTLRYMAPEQCLGQKVSPQTDIYALGIIMYEALTRQRAVGKTVESVLNDPIVPLKMRVKEIPPMLEKLIESMIEKKPENRPKSVLDVKKVIQSLMGKANALKTSPSQHSQHSQHSQQSQFVSSKKELTPPPFIKANVPTHQNPIQTPSTAVPKNLNHLNASMPSQSPPHLHPPPFQQTQAQAQAQTQTQQVYMMSQSQESIMTHNPQQPISTSYAQTNLPYTTENPSPIQVVQPMNYHSSRTFGWDDPKPLDLHLLQQPINEQSTAFLNTNENEPTNTFKHEPKKGFFSFSKLLLISLVAMFLMILLKKCI